MQRLRYIPAFTSPERLGVQYLKLGEMGSSLRPWSLCSNFRLMTRRRLNLGIALYNQKKLPDAEVHLRRAVELKNGDPAAHYYLGITLVSLHQFQEAETELELAIKNGGDNIASAHKYLGGLYWSSKKNQQAIEEFQKYLKQEPKAPDADRIKGTIKQLSGQ
jgi:superkiller protein 3